MHITLQMLIDKGACAPARSKFVGLFGDAGVTITREGCLARAQVWDWRWSAKAWLTPAQFAKWAAELAPINAKWRAELATIDAKWDAEWNAIDAKWTAAWNAVYAKWRTELALAFWDALNSPAE